MAITDCLVIATEDKIAITTQVDVIMLLLCSWHVAGRGLNKMNSVTDLEAAMDYLITRGENRPSS